MSQKPVLTRDVAFRIGAAARELPRVELRSVINALIKLTDGQLSVEALGGVGVRGLRGALAEFGTKPSAASVQRAVRQLKTGLRDAGDANEDLRLVTCPAVQLPRSLRVAFTSHEGRWLDGGVMRCRRFLIYQVGEADAPLVDVRYPARGVGTNSLDCDVAARAAMLSDCHIVYTLSVGGPAMAAFVRMGVHVVKQAHPVPCVHVLQLLQRVIRDAPPPWMRKALAAYPAEGAKEKP